MTNNKVKLKTQTKIWRDWETEKHTHTHKQRERERIRFKEMEHMYLYTVHKNVFAYICHQIGLYLLNFQP